MSKKTDKKFQKTNKRLNPEDQTKYIKTIPADADINVRLERNWIKDTLDVANKALMPDNYPWAALFWIRLHGVLVEIGYKYEQRRILYEEMEAESSKKSSPEVKLMLNASDTLALAIKDLSASLSEDELIIVDYYRQTHCHVLQSGYQLGVSGDKLKGGEFNKLKTEYSVPTLANKKFDIEYLKERIRGFLLSYSINESHMARAIAAKAMPALEIVFAKSEFFFTLTDDKIMRILSQSP